MDSIAYPQFGAKVLALGFKIGVKAAAAHAGIGAVAGAAIGYGAGTADTMLQPAFRKVLAKISAKISAKVTAKIGIRASAKVLAGFVPLVGAGVSTAISLHILNEFLASAKTYYEHKGKRRRHAVSCRTWLRPASGPRSASVRGLGRCFAGHATPVREVAGRILTSW